MSKPKNHGTVKVVLTSERGLSYAGAPCQGYMQYRELATDDAIRKLNPPHVFDLIERALGDNPEFGSVVKLTVTVEVVKRGAPSRKRCHNPWPAHRCPEKKS